MSLDNFITYLGTIIGYVAYKNTLAEGQEDRLKALEAEFRSLGVETVKTEMTFYLFVCKNNA